MSSHRIVGLLAFGAMCILALRGVALAHVNGINLTVNRGATPEIAALVWTGASGGQFSVYRSTSAQTVLDPGNLIFNTGAPGFNDPTVPATGTAFFYQITSLCPYNPPEVCDGADNDCNGTTDVDAFPTLGQTCYAGVGDCRAAGLIVCNAAHTGVMCGAVANNGAAANEQCDDRDNDCDGLVDERTNGPLLGWRDQVAVVPKPGGGTVWVYTYEASRPDATMISPGSISTRACSKPGVLPWAMLTQTQAAAACASIHDSAGQPMRLCTAAEWTKACEGPAGPAAQKWSYSANPTTYRVGICNDANEAAAPCVWATASHGVSSGGANGFCYTDWAGSGQLFDMSGNLGEWTSTTVPSMGNTYYATRGGSINATQSGTTCESDAGWLSPSFASQDRGFRCCADNAP